MLIGLLLTTMTGQNGIYSTPVKAEKGNFVPRHCPTICALYKLLNQNCWSWYHFSQEKLPHTLIPAIASATAYCGKYPILFFSGPPCIVLFQYEILVKALYSVLLSQSLDSLSILHSHCTISAPWRYFRGTYMPNQVTNNVRILPGTLYTPGLRAAMWIKCLTEGQTVPSNGQVETLVIKMGVEWPYQYTTTPTPLYCTMHKCIV